MYKQMIGVGVDLCAIARIEKAMSKAHFMQRVFTQQERSYIERRGACAAQSAAAMFAGKEAVAKALGVGFARGVMPDQIEITHDEYGAPGVMLSGAAKELMEKEGGARVLLSLSHEEGTAAAFAVIEARMDT